MAKRRTKGQKTAAQEKWLDMHEKPKIKKTNAKEVGSLSYSQEQISLVKKDLLKTAIISATIFILLFGIYIYMR